MIRTELAEMIKSARERKGLTQVELAEIASIPAGTLGRIETGSIFISKEYAISLSDALGFDRKEFVFLAFLDKYKRDNEEEKRKIYKEYKEYPKVVEFVNQVKNICENAASIVSLQH